ncbi:aminoglycoside N(3)-acetyltransferase [Heyndrickxia acidicola]|uniref:Aminoglycoside N(3)-acetyltransferase n=1 Tax=Heyndrickxia acidicola TaxID=209389 RepID=A0ABU6MF71_9BACI|nr:AAC(3) family N-acetyltransferase [Heyndrickxia acidicola]MED1202333.1 AAC(3) family N-acetyltransferase [Heyndrickxia acidicola]
MSLQNSTRKPKTMATKETLIADFTQLGLKRRMNVIVHASLSKIGWVCGGEITVIQALMETITNEGTIIMPAQNTNNSEPSYWKNPPVPKEWWEDIRAQMPAYDPKTTPTFGMGKIAETFRSFPGVLRSAHPMVSFTAWGQHAEYITASHSIDYPFGEHSPLARIYDLNGHILLLGVDYNRNTSMHLGEFRCEKKKEFLQGSAINENGKRVWKVFKDIEESSEDFTTIAKNFEKIHQVRTGTIGAAPSKLIEQRLLVDFTSVYLKQTLI